MTFKKTMDNKDGINQDVELLRQLASSDEFTKGHAESIRKIINNYFTKYGRDQRFRSAKDSFLPKFKKILPYFDPVHGIEFTEQFFLFCYTLSEDWGESQKKIQKHVAEPYEDWVNEVFRNFKNAFNFRDTKTSGSVLFIIRHGVTQGMYAPGKSMYSAISALAVSNKFQINVVAIGDTDEEFNLLSRTFNNVHVTKLIGSDFNNKLSSILDIIKLTGPRSIITEMEFNISSLIGILSRGIPSYYLSQGYYALPWYSYIVLPEHLRATHISDRPKELIFVPTNLSFELLAPKANQERLNYFKEKMKITDDDIIIGSFGRMEKFSHEFLMDCKYILDQIPKAKIVLAGSNDRSNCEIALADFINEGRAFVFPPTDVHNLGYLLHYGLDSHPNPSGYAALELLAKGKPVICRARPELLSWRSQRQESLLYSSNQELKNLFSIENISKDVYEKLSAEAVLLAKSFCEENNAQFLRALNF